MFHVIAFDRGGQKDFEEVVWCMTQKKCFNNQ